MNKHMPPSQKPRGRMTKRDYIIIVVCIALIIAGLVVYWIK